MTYRIAERKRAEKIQDFRRREGVNTPFQEENRSRFFAQIAHRFDRTQVGLYIGYMIRTFLFSTICGVQMVVAAPAKQYEAQDFSHLIGMKGLNKELLTDHFTLYQGYVKNTNLLMDLLGAYVQGKPFDYQYQALKRRFGWEFDGMRLHEYYFENLGGKTPLDRSSSLFKMIERDFGSFDLWKKDYIATGMMRGIGWAILYYDWKAKRLFNTWINEHDLGHLAGGEIILVMDVWEHAYMPQYGLDRRTYIDAFFQNINWKVAASRLGN